MSAIDRQVAFREVLMKYIFDDSAFSNQESSVSLSFGVWFKYNWQSVVSFYVVTAFSVYLSLQVSAVWILATLLCLIFGVAYARKVKEHLTGEVLPAVVLPGYPARIAVYANASKFGQFYPIVKIELFNNLNKHPAGTRITTIAQYSDYDKDGPVWTNVRPLPVEYVTDNAAEHENKMLAIDAWKWNLLEAKVSDLKPNVAPGLYRIQGGDSRWRG